VDVPPPARTDQRIGTALVAHQRRQVPVAIRRRLDERAALLLGEETVAA
jgi:hypothetical protein